MECSVIYRAKFPLLKDKETEPIVGWDFSLYFVSFNQFSLVIWRMGDHFVLLVDRLLTESTLEAAIKSERQLQQAMSSASKDYLSSSRRINFNTSLSPGKLVECKICHDEDEESNMETPCSCCGSLKVS